MSIESVMPSNHLILCHHLLLLPSIFPTSGSFPMSQLFPSGGQSIGVGSLSLLQQVFPTQESNQGLLHCRQILYQLSYQGSSIGKPHREAWKLLKRSKIRSWNIKQGPHPISTTYFFKSVIIILDDKDIMNIDSAIASF